MFGHQAGYNRYHRVWLAEQEVRVDVLQFCALHWEGRKGAGEDWIKNVQVGQEKPSRPDGICALWSRWWYPCCEHSLIQETQTSITKIWFSICLIY